MRRLSPAPCAPRAGWLALCARLCEHRHSVSVAACVMRSSPRDSTHTEGIRMHTAQRLNALQSPRILSSSQHTHACVLGCQHMISVIISMRGSGRSTEEKKFYRCSSICPQSTAESDPIAIVRRTTTEENGRQCTTWSRNDRILTLSNRHAARCRIARAGEC